MKYAKKQKYVNQSLGKNESCQWTAIPSSQLSQMLYFVDCDGKELLNDYLGLEGKAGLNEWAHW